jgi:hypothetical protein
MKYIKAWIYSVRTTVLAVIVTVVSIYKVPQFIADADKDETALVPLILMCLSMIGCAIALWLYPIWDMLKEDLKTKKPHDTEKTKR